jgi:hypothetical protein
MDDAHAKRTFGDYDPWAIALSPCAYFWRQAFSLDSPQQNRTISIPRVVLLLLELKLLYIPEQMYRKKDFVVNYNESDLYRLGIEPGSPDSLSNALPIELTGRIWSFLCVVCVVYA